MANVNGEITALKDARISVMDRGFLFGDSIYEVVRTYDGVPFYFEEHCDRLENSARLARIRISQSRHFLRDEIRRTIVSANPSEDVFIRYAISRGCGALDLDPTVEMQSSYIIFVKELPQWNAEFYRSGMKLAVPRTRRNSPQTLDPNIKSGNYMNNILALAEAKDFGADDALLLSIDDKLTEATNSNALFVMDGRVVSPLHDPKSSTGNLKGLTKKIISEICQREKIPYIELQLGESDLRGASECFVSSATREIMPVKEIRWSQGEQQSFPDGGGLLTRRLQALYKDFIRDSLRQSSIEPWFSAASRFR